MDKYLRLLCILAWLTGCSLALGTEHHGQVVLGGVPVPGAVVTVSQGDKKLVAVTDEQGIYSFPDLNDGSWTVEIGMPGFSSIKQDVMVAPNALAAKWELKMLPLDQMMAASAPPARLPEPPAGKAEGIVASTLDPSQDTSDGLLINGSVNNGAASPFTQAGAFGNNRSRPKALYTGGIVLIVDNSALDAQAFSLTGQNTPKPFYNDLTGGFTLGGPLRIPHLLRNGPNFFVGYQWTRNRVAAAQPGLLPVPAARNGIFSNSVLDPLTGAPFSGNAIPQNRISPQARALLTLILCRTLPEAHATTTRSRLSLPRIGTLCNRASIKP